MLEHSGNSFAEKFQRSSGRMSKLKNAPISEYKFINHTIKLSVHKAI